MDCISNPVLIEFRAELGRLYGHRLERVVLFGSRARGDAREESDYDVAVFLNDLTDRWREIDKIVEIETDILCDSGAVINALPFQAGSYSERIPLMREIRKDGVAL